MSVRATVLEKWLFFVAVIFLSGGPTSLYVKASGYAPALPDAALLVPLLFVMIVNMVIRLRATLMGSLAALPWVAFAGLALASYVWSVSPNDTLREAGVMAVAVPYLAMVAVIMDWRDIVSRAWWACVILAVIAFGLYLIVPSLGQMQDVYAGALSGPWYEKNAAGQFGCWAGLLSLALIAMRPKMAIPGFVMFGLCVVMVILTQSTTALLALMGGTCVVAVVALLRRMAGISIVAAVFGTALAVPIGMMMFEQGPAILGALGKTDTLTGRLPIWDALRTFALGERPWLGHGYQAYWSDGYAFSRREFVYDQLGFEARHAHNSWIEARLALGWAGCLAFSAAGVQAFLMSLVRLRRSNGAYVTLPLIAAGLTVCLVETSLTSVVNLGGMLFVLALAKMTLRPSAMDQMSGLAGLAGSTEPREAQSRLSLGPALA